MFWTGLCEIVVLGLAQAHVLSADAIGYRMQIADAFVLDMSIMMLRYFLVPIGMRKNAGTTIRGRHDRSLSVANEETRIDST